MYLNEKVCADTGASNDVLGVDSIKKLDSEFSVDPIELDTAGPDPVNVTALGDVQHLPGLETKNGLIAPWSDVTLLSITKRLKVGWTFWCEKDFAVLSDPAGKEFYFRTPPAEVASK